MISKKAAVQITATFLVSMIVGIVLFGLGITFIAKFTDFFGDQANHIDAQVSDQVRNMAMRDNGVAVYPAQADVHPGDSQLFYVGIQNELGADKHFKFVVKDINGMLYKIGGDSSITDDEIYIAQDPSMDWEVKNNDGMVDVFRVYLPSTQESKREKFVVYFQESATGAPNSWTDYKSPIIVYIDVP